MWTDTAVSRRLGTRYPLVQGAFGGGLSTVELAAAVSNAGGLGSFGAHGLNGEEIVRTVRDIRALTDSPFAINLWIPREGNGTATPTPDENERGLRRLRPYFVELGLPEPEPASVVGLDFGEQVRAVLESRPPVFSFVFGLPAPDVLEECQRRGIVTLGTATHVDEAVALERAGVDAIVASGFEAGGHRTSFLRPVEEAVAASALLPQVVDAVRVPVIAAGGIADGRGVVAMFALGAQGVQVGTAFLACDESGAPAVHKAALLEPGARYTALTRAFTGRAARGIVNRFVTEMRPHEAELPPYPIQAALTLPIRRAAAEAGRPEFMSLWAGQNAPLVKRRRATELVEFLVTDTRRVRERLHAAGTPETPYRRPPR